MCFIFGGYMLSTRQIFNYTLFTGNDLFDDLKNLEIHSTKRMLHKKNKYNKILAQVLNGLDVIGIDVDNVDLSEILAPTVKIDDSTDSDFIPYNDTELNAIDTRDEQIVSKVLESFIITKHINSDILLDAPFDMAVKYFNNAMKTKANAQKRN